MWKDDEKKEDVKNGDTSIDAKNEIRDQIKAKLL